MFFQFFFTFSYANRNWNEAQKRTLLICLDKQYAELLLLFAVVCCFFCSLLLLPGVVIVVVMLVVFCWFCFLGNLHANNCLILFRTALGIINWQFYGLPPLLLPLLPHSNLYLFCPASPLRYLFCLRWLRIYILTTGKKQVRSERRKKVKLI